MADTNDDVVAIRAVRDALGKKLDAAIAARTSVEVSTDVVLDLSGVAATTNSSGFPSLTVRICRRGGAWLPGKADAKTCIPPVVVEKVGEPLLPKIPEPDTYNTAVHHDVDPSGLILSDRALAGILKVTMNAGALPKYPVLRPLDGKPRKVSVEIGGTVTDGAVVGKCAVSGELGEYSVVVTGRVARLDEKSSLSAMMSCDSPTGVASQVTMLYHQIRALDLALRYPHVSLSNALEIANLPYPNWNAGDRDGPAVYTKDVRRAVARLDGGKDETADVTVDGIAIDDPWFGTSEKTPLPLDGSVLPMVSVTASTNAAARWQYIPHWQVVGGFPGAEDWTLETPRLPEMIHSPGASYLLPCEWPAKVLKVPEDGHVRWEKVTCPSEDVLLPIAVPKAPTKTPYRWFAETSVIAAEDCTLYATATAEDLGKLWINGRLAWVQRNMQNLDSPRIFRVKLARGTNTLSVSSQRAVCAGLYSAGSTFAFALCTSGRPRTPQEIAAAPVTVAKPSAAFGYRGDNSGRFPEATPCLAWDVEKNINIVWRTELPDYSCANPVIAGDRVFVNCEPHTLYCLDKKTGKVLWVRDSHIFDLLPEGERAVAKQAWDDSARAGAGDSKEAEELKELRTQEAETNSAIEDLRTKDPESSNIAVLEAKLKEIQGQLRAVEEKRHKDRKWRRELGVRDPGSYNCYGWTMATPVTDGTNVWVRYGTGVAACYAMDGTRKWLIRTYISGSVAQITSPVLSGNALIVQGALSRGPKDAPRVSTVAGTWSSLYDRWLIAVNRDTGAILWERPITQSGYGSCGGMFAFSLTAGGVSRDVLVCSRGDVIDPVNGRQLMRPLLNNCHESAPFLIGNKVHMRHFPLFEFRLDEAGCVSARPVPPREIHAGTGNRAGLVSHNGLLYETEGYVPVVKVKKSAKWRGFPPVPWHKLNVVEASTGLLVTNILPVFRAAGHEYTPPSSAGDYIFAAETGGGLGWSILMDDVADVAVVKPGREPYEVVTSAMDAPMTGSLVFEKDRMYARTYKSAMCIGVVGESGKTYVSERKAETLFGTIEDRPEEFPKRVIAPRPGFAPPPGLAVESCDAMTAPREWFFAGPFPRNRGEPLDAMGGVSNAMPTVGASIAFGGTNIAFAVLGKENYKHDSGLKYAYLDTPVYSASAEIDLMRPIGEKQDSITYYYAVISNDVERLIRPDIGGGSGIAAWLSGQPISPKEGFLLAPGCHPLLMRAEIARVPPIGRVMATVRFVTLKDPRVEIVKWRADIKSKLPRLEEVIRELPGTEQSRKALSLIEWAGCKTAAK
jgi:hypothetical protein